MTATPILHLYFKPKDACDIRARLADYAKTYRPREMAILWRICSDDALAKMTPGRGAQICLTKRQACEIVNELGDIVNADYSDVWQIPRGYYYNVISAMRLSVIAVTLRNIQEKYFTRYDIPLPSHRLFELEYEGV